MWEHAAIVAPESAAYRIVHGVWIGCAIAADILWGSGCLALVCDYVSRAIFLFAHALPGLPRSSSQSNGLRAASARSARRSSGNTIDAIIDPAQRRIDFCDELARTIARSQLDRPVRLAGGPVGRVGLAERFRLQYL